MVLFKDKHDSTTIITFVSESNDILISIQENNVSFIGVKLDIETAIKFKKALTHEIQKAKQKEVKNG